MISPSRQTPFLAPVAAVLFLLGCGAIDHPVLPTENGSPGDQVGASDEDAALLEEIQRTTFRYFWELAHPVSGLAYDRIAIADPPTRIVPFDTRELRVSPTGEPGARGEYFVDGSFSRDPALVRVDPSISFRWRGAPSRGLPKDGFYVRWQGVLTPERSETVTLGLGSDDGSRLFLDGERVIENWGDHGYQVVTSAVRLEEGRPYTFEILFYDNRRLARIDFGRVANPPPRVESQPVDIRTYYGMDRYNGACAVGGTGMGVMSILVGIERGWITAEEGLGRTLKIVEFLSHADRFHGIFPHFMDGTTGKVIPFSRMDDGGDIVETAFLFQGLLTAREYFNGPSDNEKRLREIITRLWDEADWNWYTNGQDHLYWHWSPRHSFGMNHVISGWNECLIAYVLAAASPTHSIREEVYHSGWARNGAIRNRTPAYGMTLPLGIPTGGPLFFTHYSFLGMSPKGLSDRYANYWDQNRTHTLINRAYCLENPRGYKGYGAGGWGLTASDNPDGYGGHAPDHDLGVIAPTAALSSFPYTPAHSFEALKHFRYDLGEKIWAPAGFVDAYAPSRNWAARTHLSIDQGTILIMIENYRTGLLWNLFGRIPDVQRGLERLGFHYDARTPSQTSDSPARSPDHPPMSG